MSRKSYITFIVSYVDKADIKFAVECDSVVDACEVAYDANSLDGVKYIRLRRCCKPEKRHIISYADYWDYKKWYNL